MEPRSRAVRRLPTAREWVLIGLAGFALVVLAAVVVWREDILRTSLDPKVPYQTYDPPPAPDYVDRAAWALLPRNPEGWTAADPAADVFFVHPTTYDGGRHWNAPIGEPRAERTLQRVMLPNYAGPFARVGRVFAPRYRQASLYSMLTLRDDARDARAFAYQDVRDAFRAFLARGNGGRPIVIVGVEQGGVLVDRLLQEEVAPNPDVLSRLAGAYAVDAVVPADLHGPSAPVPACAVREQAGCVVAYAQVVEGLADDGATRLSRALTWTERGGLAELGGRRALCVNPLTGGTSRPDAPARLNLGAAAATDVEWGARPAFLTRAVSASCEGGLLYVSPPESPSLKASTRFPERRRAPAFNLFYADLEADALARVRALTSRPGWRAPLPRVGRQVEVRDAPVRTID